MQGVACQLPGAPRCQSSNHCARAIPRYDGR
jgi:hypothetical protein